MKVIPFKAEHLKVMDIRNHEDRLLANDGILQCLENSFADTIIIDGRVVASRGVAPSFDGVADIWLIPSVYLENHAATALRSAILWVEEMQQDFGLRRMETVCIDDRLHNRWMTALEFECEGIKRQYYKGKNYKMWSRLWE